MDRRWETRVHSILHDLIEILMPLTFLSRLLSEKLITTQEYERLSLDSIDDQKRSGTLLVSILPKRGPTSFDRFLNVLRKTKGQEHVAQMIEEIKRDERTDISPRSEEEFKELERQLKKEREEKKKEIKKKEDTINELKLEKKDREKDEIELKAEKVTNIGLRTKFSMGSPSLKWETNIPNTPIDFLPSGRVAEINGILHVGHRNRMFQFEKGAWEGEEHYLPGIYEIGSVFGCEGKGYVIDIKEKGECLSIYKWKSDSRDLEFLTRIPDEYQLYGRSAIGHNGKIYLVGGWESAERDQVDCFDINKGEWKPIKKMKNERCECSLAVIDDKMFVGGRYGDSVDCFSMEKQVWIDIKPTTKEQCELSSWNGKLVATGGDYRSNCVEMYDELSGKWLPLPSMNEGRRRHGACTTKDNQLIVVGGLGARISVECLKM